MLSNLDFVKKFLSLDEVVDLQANDDQTALHKVASNDQHEIVEELLSVQDISKTPPLQLIKMVTHLYTLYALVDLKKQSTNFWIQNMNMSCEYDVETLNDNNENVLHLAAQSGNVKVVEALVTRVKRVDQKNNSGKTSIHLPKSKNHDLVIAVLRRYL